MANFHAADLWVAVVPDVSKVGPAMQQAGKEADKGFSEGVKDIGKSLEDKLKEAGKKAGGHFSDEFKTGVKDVGKVIIAEYGPTIGAELGKVVGRSIADAAKDIPGFDTFSDVLDKVRAHGEEAQAALHSMGDAIAGIKEHDPGKVLGSLQDALKNAEPVAKEFGVDISGWQQHLSNVSTGLSGVNTALAGIKDKNPAAVIGGMTTALQGAEPLAKAMGVDLHGWEEPLGVIASGADTFVVLKESFVGLTAAAPALEGALSAIAAPLAVIAADALALKELWELAKQWSGPGQLPTPPLATTPGPAPTSPGALPGPGQPGGLPPGYHLGPGGIPIKDRAFGGPISGPGATGKDSVLLWGAPGEHMLTADDVSAMGGHGGVYNFRRALHRQGGGAFNPNIVLDPTIAARTNLSPLAPPDVGVTWNPAWGEPTGPGWQTYPDNSQDPLNPFKKRFGGAIRGFQGGGPVGRANTAGASDLPKLNTYGAQVDTIAVSQAIQKLFGISNIGMYRAADAFPEHPSGEAADIMLGGVDNPLGYTIKDWALANANVFDVLYCIWQQKMWYPGGKVEGMEDRGSPTQNHRDHVHIRTAGGGYPQGGQPAGAPSPSGTKSTPAPGVSGAMQPVGVGGGGGMVSFGGGGSPGGVTTGGGAPGGGGDTGQGGGATGDQLGQELGQGLVTGALQALGIDGSVFKSFTGKGPLDWGITKLGTGLLNWGMGTAQQYQQAHGGGGGPGAPGGVAGGALNALGIAIPGTGNVGPGGGASGPSGGGDTIHNAPVNQFNVTQNGVGNDAVQPWQAYTNSSNYAAMTDAVPTIS